MSDFEDMKPYTQAELDQQVIWANEFDQWWENEGQYQRAGGGQYERSFAWWAWLNREQKQQAIIDSLKAQLNNMEQCYIQLKQEHNELIKHDTRVDRKWKSAEKTAEKYKSKVLMIADLLRDSTDQDMTLKAIKTVIDRVGEHE